MIMRFKCFNKNKENYILRYEKEYHLENNMFVKTNNNCKKFN